MMRVIVFLSAVAGCLLYGLVFDFFANDMIGTLVCEFINIESCFIPSQLDHLLSVVVLMLVVPVGCLVFIDWFINKPKLMKSTSLVGLLFGAPY